MARGFRAAGGRNDPSPASGVRPGRLRGRDGPVARRAPRHCQACEQGVDTLGLPGLGPLPPRGELPIWGSSPSPAQWPRRAGPRGTRVGGRRQVPRCQLCWSQRCGLCLPTDLQVQQAQTRQAAPCATPGPVTAASGRRREASAPAAAPPPVHGARADVGGRATRHGNCSPVRAETPHIRRHWRCPRTHPRPPKCVPPQSKGCASVPCTPMAQPRTRWGRTHSQRQLTPNAHDVPRVGTRKPKTQSKLSPERRHS